MIRRPTANVQAAAEGLIDRVAAIRTDRAGAVLDTLCSWSVAGLYFVLRAGNRRFATGRSIVATPLIARASDGSAYAVVEMEPTSPGVSPFRVRMYLAGRGPLFDRQYADAAVRIPGSVRDSILNGRAESAVRPPGRFFRTVGEARRAFQRLDPIPEAYPPVWGAVIARNGYLWLRREDVRSDTQKWEVFDREGDRLAVVNVPGTVREVTAEHVYVTRRDDLDVSYVVRYRIRRS